LSQSVQDPAFSSAAERSKRRDLGKILSEVRANVVNQVPLSDKEVFASLANIRDGLGKGDGSDSLELRNVLPQCCMESQRGCANDFLEAVNYDDQAAPMFIGCAETNIQSGPERNFKLLLISGVRILSESRHQFLVQMNVANTPFQELEQDVF
jgi:hypothetical protein